MFKAIATLKTSLNEIFTHEETLKAQTMDDAKKEVETFLHWGLWEILKIEIVEV